MKRGPIEPTWDVVVVGGGITGAGVFRRATALGYRVLLVEQQDFAWGTSSRSGKLVHGGLRYLAQGQFRTSYNSVRERERLLKELPGLVDLVDFALPVPWGGRPTEWGMKAMFEIWDTMAGRANHRSLDADAMRAMVPGLDTRGRRGFVYGDGSTDDARLVLRILQQGIDQGGTARNYTRVKGFGRNARGRIEAVWLEDTVTGESFEVRPKVVVNATGAWVDELRAPLGKKPVIRRLRGSHLIFPQSRLPLPCAVTFPSATDRRTLYGVPWEGVTLIGTTDLDHHAGLEREPYMTTKEGDYLLEGVRKAFPELGLEPGDVICSQAGVRPVIGSGKADPSKEARDAKLMVDENLVSVSGGKLTTFDFMARRVLRRTKAFLPPPPAARAALPGPAPSDVEGPERLVGRFGQHAAEVLAACPDHRALGGTRFTLPELVYAAEHEAVVHLDDLLLRRTRLGLLLPEGGANLLAEIEPLVRPALGWTPAEWAEESARYRALWRRAYSPERIERAPDGARDAPETLAAAG